MLGSGSQVLPTTLEGLAGTEAITKEVKNKGDVDLLSSQACESNEHQERNDKALSSKCSGNQLF